MLPGCYQQIMFCPGNVVRFITIIVHNDSKKPPFDIKCTVLEYYVVLFQGYLSKADN